MSTMALASQSPVVDDPRSADRRRLAVVGAPSGRIPVRGCAGEEIGWQPASQPAPLRLTARGRRLVTAVSVLVFGAALLVLGIQAAAALGDGPSYSQTTSVQVGAGQSLWSIAEETNPSQDPRVVIEEIAALNGLRSAADLVPGQLLVIPVH